MNLTCNRYFRLMGPKRIDLSGVPWGFKMIVLPRAGAYRFGPSRCAFAIGIYWYPWWRRLYYQRWYVSIPRLQIWLGVAA